MWRRAGKSLDPKLGLLRYCVEPILDGRLHDVIVVPVSVDYERPLEVTLFSDELLGTDKEKETLPNLLKAATSQARRRSNTPCNGDQPPEGHGLRSPVRC